VESLENLTFADLWEAVADAVPDAPAQVQGDRRSSWAAFDRRADGIARALLTAGLSRQDRVALYLANCPEYLESTFGALKASLVPVNTNYRYGDDELVYLFDNADAAAVVFHAAYAERLGRIRSRLPKVRLLLCVDDGSEPCPDWAVSYEQAAASATGRVRGPWDRSGDDIYMLYTGGTTGLPKGVVWRQGDLLALLPPPTPLDELRSLTARPGPVMLPACPLMHGTGALVAFAIMGRCGSIVTLASRSFDVTELLDTVEREHVNTLVIVGDAFADPILISLDADPGRWDLSRLATLASSGAMLSTQTKQGLLRHQPGLALHDLFGSSEAMGIASSLSTSETIATTARFTLGANSRVITDDGRDVAPGSGEIGMLAVGGLIPLGYHKDPERSARTFRLVGDVRYAIPGDYATVDIDGSLHLLGRGSVCINTGGEKVYPEEVEEVLKTHPAVADAAVVGVPDRRFGEVVTAVVELRADATIDPDDLIEHVRQHLARYKAPRHVFVVESIARTPTGKLDYTHLKATAEAKLAPG
jgi:acyl-CoA synthetase (AMP-forming)/AMP-acid ligase II